MLLLRRSGFAILTLSIALFGAFAMCSSAAQDLLPEQSAPKARAVLQQVILALGGRAYLEVRDLECSGRVAQFGHNNELLGFSQVHDMWLFPDKNRTEYGKAGTIVDLFVEDHGWTLDKAGVSDQPEDAVKTFAELLKSGMNNVLRTRLNDPGVEVSYGGSDVVDLKRAEWIDISDREHRAFRLAVDQSTHLPLRWVIVTRDPETGERSEATTSYAQFVPMDGVVTPLSISRARNGNQTSQVFFASCKYNSNLSPELFTRAALEQRSAQVGKKGYRDKKESKSAQDGK